MRAILLIALAASLSATAQQPLVQTPKAGSNWQHVQALPAGTPVYVNAGGSTTKCKLASVDADTLTCAQGKSATFRRTEIKSIKVPRRVASTLIMAGLGAGLGAVVVAATSSAIGFGGHAKGSVYAGGAGIGAVLFGTIGFFTDAARSTVYKAP